MEQAVQAKKTSIDLPIDMDELGLTSGFIQELVIATLFHIGTLTSKQACDLLGKARREFEEDVLPKFGYTIMGDGPENTEIELNSVGKL
ncbi:MAG: hypothetical protein HQK57_02575 [Deltaproteobacteria bacterium]|nr:hypothetical protein [Deltaproteobacteria bacterium]MBF0524602.1 hypothetical protein [Deltaproteobacteria bacterium]